MKKAPSNSVTFSEVRRVIDDLEADWYEASSIVGALKAENYELKVANARLVKRLSSRDPFRKKRSDLQKQYDDLKARYLELVDTWERFNKQPL